MPGFDGTGPQGRGKMTGRKFGPCNPANVAGKTDSAGEAIPDTGASLTGDEIYGIGRGGVPRGGGQGFCGGRFGRGNPRRRQFF